MKNKLLLKVMVLFGFLLLLMTSKAYASSEYNYTQTGDNIVITAYTGNSTTITIPSSIDGYNVIAIGDHAFDESRNSLTHASQLREVTLSEGITTIRDFAFVGCSNIEKVTLPSTITDIGDTSFLSCSKLKEINIPQSLKSFKTHVFQETAFTEFTIPEWFESIGSGCFRICRSLKKLIVRSNNVEFDDSALEYCSNDLIIYGNQGSTAQAYANEKNITFKLLSELDNTTPTPEPEPDPEPNPGDVTVGSKIVLDKTSLNLKVGDTATLNVSFVEMVKTNIKWTSSVNKVATVADGKVTALSEGTTVITAETLDGKYKATCSVKVTKADNNQDNTNSNSNGTNGNTNGNTNGSTTGNQNSNNSNGTYLVSNNGTDTTTASDGKIPQTGESHIVLLFISIIAGIGIVNFIKLKRIK